MAPLVWTTTAERAYVADLMVWVEKHHPTGQWNWGVAAMRPSPTPYIKGDVWTTIKAGKERSREDARAAGMFGAARFGLKEAL